MNILTTAAATAVRHLALCALLTAMLNPAGAQSKAMTASPAPGKEERFAWPFNYRALRFQEKGLYFPQQNGAEVLIYQYPLTTSEAELLADADHAGSLSLLCSNGFVFVLIPVPAPFPAQPGREEQEAYQRKLLQEQQDRLDRDGSPLRVYPTYDSGYTLIALNSPSIPRDIHLSWLDIWDPTVPGVESLLSEPARERYRVLKEKIAAGNDNINFPTDHRKDVGALRLFLAEALNRDAIDNPNVELIKREEFKTRKLPVQILWLYQELPRIQKALGREAFLHIQRALNRLLLDYLLPQEAFFPASQERTEEANLYRLVHRAQLLSTRAVRWRVHVRQEKIARLAIKDNRLLLLGEDGTEQARFDPLTGASLP